MLLGRGKQQIARRLAHEIKNPLTPIQLAIQQVREKDPGLSPEFSALLRTSVEIVEDEVEALFERGCQRPRASASIRRSAISRRAAGLAPAMKFRTVSSAMMASWTRSKWWLFTAWVVAAKANR